MPRTMTSLPRPTGLYVHIPFCDGKCGYCAFYSVPYDSSLAERLLAALAKELALAQPAGIPPALETIYVGGGTPSILSESQLERLGAIIQPRAGKGGAEWTVEINPGSLTAAKLAALVRAGVNRISLGAQSFDDRVLARLGRRHSAADVLQGVDLIRRAGVKNFGLDLIAGVPGFDVKVWRHTLEQTVALAPRHVSVYALTAEEGSRLARAMGGGETALLSDDEQLAALATAETALTSAGYLRYEISNYARPGFECRHHCAAWRGGEYLGLGPAAASHVGLERWTNRPDLAAYLAALEQGRQPPRECDHLTPAVKAMERVIFGLRMAEGVSAETAGHCASALRNLEREGMTVFRAGRWALTPRGRQVADAVAVELLGA